MANSLLVGNTLFPNSEIVNATIHVANAMIGETLSADEAVFEIYSTAGLVDGAPVPFLTEGEEQLVTSLGDNFLVDAGDMDFSYGVPVSWYKDGELNAQFYLKQARRVSKYTYQITATSGIGLMIDTQHNGGIYEGDTAGDIIDDILQGAVFSYTVDADVAGTTVYGWLPIASSRDNLQQLLFAIGASVIKQNGSATLRICFNDPDTAKAIPDTDVYLGGKLRYISPATSALVIEHTFYPASGALTEVLFDNSGGAAADHDIITFAEPVQVSTITAAGITVHAIHPNYAEISGIGTITGKYYVHIKRELTANTGATGATKQVRVEKATLVSQINSFAVLERVKAYYSQADEISTGIVYDGEKPGDLVLFTSPFGDQVSGYIKELDLTLSNTIRGDAKIAVNWKPGHPGNAFTAYELITESGTWTPPPEKVGQPAMFVLFAGGHGGDGGQNGAQGGQNTPVDSGNGRVYGVTPAPGGVGGAGGNGGAPGKYLIAIVPTLAASYAATVGAGGAGGAVGAAGSAGGATEIGPYSTDDGTDFPGNYINIIDGSVYATAGENGAKGGNGGDGGGAGAGYIDYEHINGYDGENVPPNVGGAGGSVYYEYESYYSSSNAYHWSLASGGGGGAAAGADGGAVVDPYSPPSGRSWTAGKGGDGADAHTPAQAALGCGGHGGNGGGGGGGSAGAWQERHSSESHKYWWTYQTTNYGAGGAGSPGGQGGDGFIIVYY